MRIRIYGVLLVMRKQLMLKWIYPLLRLWSLSSFQKAKHKSLYFNTPLLLKLSLPSSAIIQDLPATRPIDSMPDSGKDESVTPMLLLPASGFSPEGTNLLRIQELKTSQHCDLRSVLRFHGWQIWTEKGPQFRWQISRFLKPNSTATLAWHGGGGVGDSLLWATGSCPQNGPRAWMLRRKEKWSFCEKSIGLYLLPVSSSLMWYKSNNVPGNELINSYSFYSIIKVWQDWIGV